MTARTRHFGGANLAAAIHVILDEQLSVLCTSVNPTHGPGSQAENAAKLVGVHTRHCKMRALSIASLETRPRDKGRLCRERRYC
jgi:hypothetical protein